MSNRLEKIINLKLNNFEIVPPKEEMIEPNPCWEGYEAIGTKIVDGKEVPNCVPIKENMETTKVDLADYPWEQCIADQIKQYGDEETAKKVCGAIKAMYASKQEFVIPTPGSDESENDYISRCNSAIYNEFPDEAQRNAVCYAQWEKK